MRRIVYILVGLGLFAALVWAGIAVLDFIAQRLPRSTTGVYFLEERAAYVPDGGELVFMLGTKATYFVSVRGDAVLVSTAFYSNEYQICPGSGLEIQINVLGTTIYVQDGDGGMVVYLPYFARVRF